MANSSDVAVTLSIRIPQKTRDQLEALAKATGRTKSFLAAEAIKDYLATNAWHIEATHQALIESDKEGAATVEHDDVSEWLSSWGDKDEKDPPE